MKWSVYLALFTLDQQKEGRTIDKSVYRDAFNFHEKYHNRLHEMRRCTARAVESFWKDECDEMIQLSRKHNQDNFAMDLLLCIHTQLEREAKALRLA